MNIVNGDSAAGGFKQAFDFPAESTLIFRDVLSCGPLLRFENLKNWAEKRRHYWQGVAADNGVNSIDDIHNTPNDFYQSFDALKNSQTIKLWIGCALSDQLLMVFIVKLFEYYHLDTQRIEIYQYLKHGEKNITVIGLGILSPTEIKTFEPTPLNLSNEQINECLNVWQAITSTTPDAFMQLMATNNTHLPLLNTALNNIVYRYPQRENGLTYADELILRYAKELYHDKKSPQAARVIGYVLAHNMQFDATDNIHTLDVVGDWVLFSRLKKMANPKLVKPLLELNVMNQPMRGTKVKVTDFGLAVLAGEQNVVEVNGLDDWVGGVCLDSAGGSVWYNDGGEIK